MWNQEGEKSFDEVLSCYYCPGSNFTGWDCPGWKIQPPIYSRAPVYLFRDDVLTPSPSFIPDPTYIPDLCVAQVKPYLRFTLYKLKTVLFLLISSSESSCVSKCEEFYTRTWKTHVGPAFIILGELIKDTVMYTCP